MPRLPQDEVSFDQAVELRAWARAAAVLVTTTNPVMLTKATPLGAGAGQASPSPTP